MDLDAYFQRIDYQGERAPTIDVLRQLHLCHTQTIPFENLDSLLGRRVDLDLDALERKLVAARRGGYCFEQNALFAAALEAIGFRVTRLAARVIYLGDVNSFPPRTHMLLRVDVGEESWIADVGFGGLVLTAPMRLAADLEQQTPHEAFRIVRWRDEYVMEALVREAWIPLYRFTLQEQAPADYEVGNWYVSTHPSSLFVNQLVASRPAPGLRYAMRGNALSIHRLNAGTEHRTLETVDELRSALADLIGIDLPEGPEVEELLQRIAKGSAADG